MRTGTLHRFVVLSVLALCLTWNQPAGAYDRTTGRAYSLATVTDASYPYNGIRVVRPDTAYATTNLCGQALFPEGGFAGDTPFIYMDMWLIQDGNRQAWAEFFTSDRCTAEGQRIRCWEFQIWHNGIRYVADFLTQNFATSCGLGDAFHAFEIAREVLPSGQRVWRFTLDNTLQHVTGAYTFPIPGAVVDFGLETTVAANLTFAAQNWNPLQYRPPGGCQCWTNINAGPNPHNPSAIELHGDPNPPSDPSNRMNVRPGPTSHFVPCRCLNP